MMPSCKRPVTLDRRYTKVPEETGKSSAKREYVFKVDCPIQNPYLNFLGLRSGFMCTVMLGTEQKQITAS